MSFSGDGPAAPGEADRPFLLDIPPVVATIRGLMKTFAARYYWYWYPR
jgi:hypothetical protein